MSIVENIKSLCSKENLSIPKLEKHLGLSNGSIYNWDKNSPSVEKLIKVASHFNCSLNYLVDKEENPLSPELQTIVQYLNDKSISKQQLALIMHYLHTMFEQN